MDNRLRIVVAEFLSDYQFSPTPRFVAAKELVALIRKELEKENVGRVKS